MVHAGELRGSYELKALFLLEDFGAAKGENNCLRQTFDDGKVSVIESKSRAAKHFNESYDISFVARRGGENRADAKLPANIGIYASV